MIIGAENKIYIQLTSLNYQNIKKLVGTRKFVQLMLK